MNHTIHIKLISSLVLIILTSRLKYVETNQSYFYSERNTMAESKGVIKSFQKHTGRAKEKVSFNLK